MAEQQTISALHKTISALRQQKRGLIKMVEDLKKTSSLANEVASIGYSGGRFESLNLASQVLTAISWDDYPAKSFDNLVEALRGINSGLGDEIAERGVDYHVLYSDETKDSGFFVAGLAIDTEGWYESLDSVLVNEFREDEALWNRVTDAIDCFAFEVKGELMTILEEKNIALEDVEALIED